MKPLNPYRGGPEPQPATGVELVELVAFYKRTADQNGEPYDPEWDRWIAEDRGEARFDTPDLRYGPAS